MSKHWFYKLLLSYMPIFVMMACILALIFFFSLQEISIGQAKHANKISAQQIAKNVETSMQLIEQMVMKEIHAEHSIGPFFAQDTNPYHMIYGPSDRINHLISMVPQIHSVYLYRIRDEVILSPNMITYIEQFGDREFIRYLNENDLPGRWTHIRSFKEFMDGDAIPVTSLVRKVPLLSGELGLMVVNVSADALRKMLSDMLYSESNYIHLVDQEGMLLSAADGKLYVPGDAPETAGTELARVTSAYTDWEIRTGITNRDVFNYVSNLPRHWVILGLVTVLLGLASIVMISRRNYRPLEHILSRIDQISWQKKSTLAKSGGDEFKFIDWALDSLIEQTNTYQQQHQEDLIFRKQNFFNELVNGTRPISMEEWSQETSRFGLAEDFDYLQLALVEMDKYKAFCRNYSYHDQYLLKFVISSAAMELAQKESLHVWVEWTSEHQLGMLFRFIGEHREQALKVLNMCRELVEWVDNHLHFTITISVGREVRTLEQLPLNYEQLVERLKHKVVLGHNKVLTAEDSAAKSEIEVYAHLRTIRGMAQAFRLGNEEWKQHFQQFFDHLSQGLVHRDDLVIAMNYISHHIEKEIEQLSEEYKALWKEETQEQVKQLIDQFEVLSELRQQLYQLLDSLSHRMDHIRKTKSTHAMVRQIQSYIETHYANPDLSLNHLSDNFNLHPKYISQLFKEEIGEKFVDYLAKIRIEHAEKLLLHTDYSIQNISHQVGYMNALSFNRLFKKMHGLPPGEFRKQNA